MRIYIQTDVEGVAGYTSFEDRVSQSVENFYHRQRMYRLLTGQDAQAGVEIRVGAGM
jgi:D-aminopeptidase